MRERKTESFRCRATPTLKRAVAQLAEDRGQLESECLCDLIEMGLKVLEKGATGKRYKRMMRGSASTEFRMPVMM